MNAIRQKLLISSLKLSCAYKKSVNSILNKLVKDEQKIEKLESMLVKKDFLDVLLTMIQSGEIFKLHKKDDKYLVGDMFNLLTDEQKKAIYIELVTGKNKDKVVINYNDITFSSFVNEHNIISILGELLYDVSFWEKLPKIGEKPFLFLLDKPMQDLNTFINSLDIQRIINDEKLLDYFSYIAFGKEIPNIVLTEEQARILVSNRVYWALKYTELKNDENYVSNLILNNPNRALYILGNVPDEIKNSSAVSLSLRLSERVDLITNLNYQRENLYSVFVEDEIYAGFFMGIRSLEAYTSDKENLKLYHLLNELCKIKTSQIHAEYSRINITFTEEEEKVLCLFNKGCSYEANKGTIDLMQQLNKQYDEIFFRNPKTKQVKLKKIYEALLVINESFGTKISNQEIKQFLEKTPNIVDWIFSEKDSMDNIILSNLYYSLMNKTTDLFFELGSVYLKATNLYFLTKELVDKIGIDVIKNIVIYMESYYHLIILQKEGRIDIYNELIQISKNVPIDLHVLSNILIYTCLSYPNLIDKMKRDNELNEENVMKLINLTQLKTIIEYDETKTIDENYKDIQKYSDENIDKTQNFLIVRELFSQRYFVSSFKEVRKFYESFKDSIGNVEDKELRDLFESLGIVCTSENVDELKNIYSSFSKNNFEIDYSGILGLTSQLKEKIVGTINSTQVSPELQINDFTGKKFQFLVHVIGAYGSTIKADSLYDSWNSKSRFNNSGICTSLINDNYLGHARSKDDSVIFCFDNVEASDVQIMAPYDLYSSSYGLKTSSSRVPKFYNSNDLVNNTRAHHNEVVINRNLPGGQKRYPSYILCFDIINNESKKASEQFGIPIVFVDVKKHLEIKMQEMETLKQSFVSTQSIDTIKKIINMQETMRCGLLANNEELAQKTFNSENITSNILFLIENSKELETLNQLEILINNEKDRVIIDKCDYRDVSFNGNLNLIFEQLNIKKQKLSNSNSLSEFKNARESQMQQDRIIREQQLAGLTQEIVETKEGHSLK